MGKTKLFTLVVYCVAWLAIYKGHNACTILTDDSGDIIEKISSETSGTKCWKIHVPKFRYLVLEIRNTTFYDLPCSENYVEIVEESKNEVYSYCSENVPRDPVILHSNTIITFVYADTKNKKEYSIHYHKANEFPYVPGLEKSRDAAVSWLLKQRLPNYGWGKDTYRAITALYLSLDRSYIRKNFDGEKMIQQLKTEAELALLRNSTNLISVIDFGMLVNALNLTCQDTENINYHDLGSMLFPRLQESISIYPGSFLALCTSYDLYPISQTKKMMNFLGKSSEYAIQLDNIDVEAIIILALTCREESLKSYGSESTPDLLQLYNASISRLLSYQLPDGSFGNAYTTALVTQALMASGEVSNPSWKWEKAIKYLMKEVNSSPDMLSVSLTLPIFNKKTFMDVRNVTCTKDNKDDDISDITKSRKEILVKFSLHIDDESGIIHSLYLNMPKDRSAFDVLRLAQTVNQKYRFRYSKVGGRINVYELAGKTNDAMRQTFWIPYVENSQLKKTVRRISEGLDQYKVENGDHLIMLYKEEEIGVDDVFPNLWSTPSTLTSKTNSERTTVFPWTPMD